MQQAIGQDRQRVGGQAQQFELPADRVARTRPLVEANNAIVAQAARERLAMDDNPGDFVAWLEGRKP